MERSSALYVLSREACLEGFPVARVAIIVKEGLTGTPLHKDLVSVFERNFDVVSLEEASSSTVVISVGGDGTFLLAARKSPPEVPILGINMGRRGAVTDALPEDLPIVVERLRKGIFCIEKRIRLVAYVSEEVLEAVNEFYIARYHGGPTPTFSVVFNNEELYAERMDGIIVSTPTGSTGYNLSAGGPVLHELMLAAILTPVMPLVRIPPVVIPLLNEDDKIEILPSDRTQIVIDGAVCKHTDKAEKIVVRRSKNILKVVRLTKSAFQHLKKTI